MKVDVEGNKKQKAQKRK